MRTRKHPTMPWRRIPWPTKAQEKEWSELDASKPPEGEADGQFHSYTNWVNKAASWIGGTGAKCFDAKNRPCRNGLEFRRAQEENAFPVRFYMPDRFKPRWPRPAILHIDGFAGRRSHSVKVVGETRKYYRISTKEPINLGGRYRWLYPEATSLVPKTAITLLESST